MTHEELVKLAERWLRRHERCAVVLADVRSVSVNEQPDAIGWDLSGWSTVIECKASRPDFLRDRKKWFRARPEQGMGIRRFFLAPSGMLLPIELPERWGLLEAVAASRGPRVRMTSVGQPFESYYARGEKALLVTAVRRATEGWGCGMFGDLQAPAAPTALPGAEGSEGNDGGAGGAL